VSLPTIGWSDFAHQRHRPHGDRTYFAGSAEELLALVRDHWPERQPGTGRPDRSQVVVVPVPPDRFVCSTVRIAPDTPLFAQFERRQPDEDGFVRVTAVGPREPARYAAVVLYSAAVLVENGGSRSGDFDWEVVCLLASPHPDEPMHPLTMARNFLAKPGGTPCTYTAQQFAEAVYYWSQRAARHPGDGGS
jgi:hypothetical protein